MKLYKGDKVVMHDCMEARGREDVVWECTCDSYEICGSEVVFLKGYSGSFDTDFLRKKKMTKEEIKNKISMALKDPILQQGFECICKENAELKKKIENLQKYLDTQNCYRECAETWEQLTYAKTIIQDLLDNTDEYARQRAEDFLKENK